MNESGSWLATGFIRAMKSLGATEEGLLRREADRLLEIWQREHRVFHGKQFLVQILNFLDEQDTSLHKPAQLVVAAWYHGSVEQNCQGGSQTRSINNYASAANYVAEHLPDFGLSIENATRIAELVLFCQNKEAPKNDSDACIFIDATLSYMAQMPQAYRRSLDLLRQEMQHLEPALFARLRRSFIRSLLERDTIFSSPFASEHEKTARHNLEGELAQLNQLIPQVNRNSLKEKLEPKAVNRKSILQIVTGNDTSSNLSRNTRSNPVIRTQDPITGTVHPSKLGKCERAKQLEEEREDLSSMETVEEFLSTISMSRIKTTDPSAQFGKSIDGISRSHAKDSQPRAKLVEEELGEADGSTLSTAPVYNLEAKGGKNSSADSLSARKGPHCQIIPMQRDNAYSSTLTSSNNIRLVDTREDEEESRDIDTAEDLHLDDDQLDNLEEE